jgi:hypothetical protein
MIRFPRYLRTVKHHQFSIHQTRSSHLLFRDITRPQNASLTRQVGQVQNRGARTKSSIKLDDLPQGVIPLEPLPLEEKEPVLPTVLKQVRSNMIKFENCVVLTRVGGFYELYFEQADELGPLLNLKVAPKWIKPKGNWVPMVPIPFLYHVQ